MAAKTNAVRLLEGLGIAFTLRGYQVAPADYLRACGGAYAAIAREKEPSQT